MSQPTIRQVANPAFRKSASTIGMLLLSTITLAACATTRPPQISYDANVPPLPAVAVSTVDGAPRPILVPPAWTPAKGGDPATTPTGAHDVRRRWKTGRCPSFPAGGLYMQLCGAGFTRISAIQQGFRAVGIRHDDRRQSGPGGRAEDGVLVAAAGGDDAAGDVPVVVELG